MLIEQRNRMKRGTGRFLQMHEWLRHPKLTKIRDQSHGHVAIEDHLRMVQQFGA